MDLGITGHRPEKLGNDYALTSLPILRIKQRLIQGIERFKPDNLVCGMALGIDTLFALLAMEMDIPLIAAVPFLGQESRWPQQSVDLYKKILAWHKTTVVIVCTGGYGIWKMQTRNEWIVDHVNDPLVAVWDGSPGGTANCVKYAGKVNRNIVRIDPKTAKIVYYQVNDSPKQP